MIERFFQAIENHLTAVLIIAFFIIILISELKDEK